MVRCLRRLGALPGKLVWDRDGAIAPKGRPTEEFLGFCGQLALGWIVLDAGDCQAKGALERSHRFVHGNFEAGRRFANHIDFQDQLDRWCDKVNQRVHRTTRAVVAERLVEEQALMRPLPQLMPDSDRRLVTQGGAYINNLQIANVDHKVTAADLATETMLVVGSGKREKCIVRAV